MNKTQKNRRLGWALTGALFLFLISVQPAFPERPNPKTSRAKATPASTVTQDRSEYGGGESLNDDSIARDVVKATTEYKQVDEQLAVTPPGPQREALERKAQSLSDGVARSVDGCPNCPATLTAAAGMAMSEKNPEKAHGLADRAVVAAEQATNDPKQAAKLANALTTRGLFLEKAGEFERAHADAKYALKVKPGDKAALGLLNLTAGRVKAGAAPAPTVAQARPAQPGIVPSPYRDPQVQMAGERALGRQQAINFYNKAKSSNNLNDTARALEYAQAAIRADPSLPDSYMERAKALLGMKGGDRRDQLAQAINDLRSAMELWMKNGQTGRLAEANGLSAKAKNASGDYNGAQDDANKAMSYNAGYAPAFWERGAAREALKQRELALADYNKSSELQPEYGAARDEATARLMAPETARVPVARPAESALHQAWVKLLGKAGGGFHLFLGAMGALFVLSAGYVFWFAKEGSRASRVRSFFTRPSQVVTVTTPVPAEEPCEIGGHIDLRREIARGGMGVIFEGFDRNLKRPVAVKRLLPELQSEDFLKRIIVEAQILALFHHPHIVEIYEVIMEGGGIFLVQPLLDGNTVYVELNETPGRRLTTERVFEIVRAVAGAIDYSHAKGVIHRDLKPSNIMVTKDGRILLMDYGIAKSDANNAHLTKTGSSIGTPAYMAPEQEQGRAVKQSDVFALAASTYEMFSGKRPFGVNDLFRKLQKEPGRFVALSSRRHRPGCCGKLKSVTSG